MSKILKSLDYQLKTEFKDDVKEIIVIYDYLFEKHNGYIWGSNWNPLVNTDFIGDYPNSHKIYSLTDIGEIVYKNLKK